MDYHVILEPTRTKINRLGGNRSSCMSSISKFRPVYLRISLYTHNRTVIAFSGLFIGPKCLLPGTQLAFSTSSMARPKSKEIGIPNKPAFCRMSYLYQASTYLATVQTEKTENRCEGQAKDETAASNTEPQQGSRDDEACHSLQNRSRALLSDLRQISRKTQLRMSPTVKHSVCKFCDTLLIEGQSCVSTVENKSKGGQKPWADTLVRKCNTCGRERRFPVDAPRQKRRSAREAERKVEDG